MEIFHVTSSQYYSIRAGDVIDMANFASVMFFGDAAVILSLLLTELTFHARVSADRLE
jgi:hypothetical protein